MSDVETLLADARALGILGHLAANEVHCPTCYARLFAFGECASCGVVGRSEDEVRRMDPTVAAALLERSITRRKAYQPEKKAAR